MSFFRCWHALIFPVLLFCAGFWMAPVLAEAGTSIKKTDDFFSCAMISQSRSILVGDRGRIFLSDDEGKTWQSVDCPTQEPLASVDFVNESKGWIVGQKGTILHSEDGGETWQVQTSQTGAYLLAVDFFDFTTGCAVGENSTVLVTTDSGNTWRTSDIQAGLPANKRGGFLNGDLFAVVMLSLREICISGEYGRIFVTDNAGRTWRERRSPLYDPETGKGNVIYGMTHDAGALYAVGIDSVFIFSKNRGKTWQRGRTGFSEPALYAIAMSGDLGMAVGAGGHIIFTRDRGETWEKIKVPDDVARAALVDVCLRRHYTGDDTGVIVGQQGRVGWYGNGAFNW